MLLPILSIISAVSFPAPAAVGLSNLQLVIPSSLLNTYAVKVGPLIDKYLDNISLPTCCYDDVGVKNTHLDLEHLAIGNATTDVAVSASATGIAFDINLSLVLTGYYDVCIHVNPINKKECHPLEGCRGDFAIDVGTAISIPMKLVPGANGTLSIVPGTPSFKLPTFNLNLCSTIKDPVEKALPEIESDVTKSLTEFLQKIAANLTHVLPLSVNTKLFGLTLYSGSDTGTDTGSIMIDGFATVHANQSSLIAPYTQRVAFPSMPTDPNRLGVRLGESLLSDLLWAVGRDNILNLRFNHSLLNGTKIEVLLHPSPFGLRAFLNSSLHRVIMPWIMTGYQDNVNGIPVFNATVNSHLGLEVSVQPGANSTAKIELQLESGPIIDSVVGDCDSVCQDMILKAKVELAVVVAAVNTKLRNTTLPVPSMNGHLTSFNVSFGDAFVEIGGEFQAASYFSDLMKSNLFQKSLEVKCPTIPKAHQDGCKGTAKYH
eukprot:m.342882 g.342882  ORF g.342882 m.342882 type:complete len:487 (-) comp21960_c0_seq1:143-1603(-)